MPNPPPPPPPHTSITTLSGDAGIVTVPDPDEKSKMTVLGAVCTLRPAMTAMTPAIR